MQKDIIVDNSKIKVYSIKHLVIGSGCAGLNAADWLWELGERDVALITEGMNMGTSRNTGSDKQTYYKLSLGGTEEDSVRKMARTLFEGGGMDGELALIQSACSIKAFIKLVSKGVHFPTNEYGEYIGYKTDYDPMKRATSAGPLTSKYMTEALQHSVESKGIRVFDEYQVIKLLVEGNRIYGVLTLNRKVLKDSKIEYTIFWAENVILATGGPANVYQQSVYPESQSGSTGLAIEVGAKLANMNAWQYGLASTAFRWNVSGSYQQVLPRYISVDTEGNEKEFLIEHFKEPCEALNHVFLKGYEWPFDSKKIEGSSMIDILVHNEIMNKDRRVFLDFRTEPQGIEKGFEGLNQTTYEYLNQSKALVKTPIKRLEKINPQAVNLYKSQGINLYEEALEIAVCAQHHNGGVAVDSHWQTSVEGLYAVGEIAGTFGNYRPGGAALNAGQVGGMRAAEHIVYNQKNSLSNRPDTELLLQVESFLDVIKALIDTNDEECQAQSTIIACQNKMSKYAAHLRDKQKIPQLYEQWLKDYPSWNRLLRVNKVSDLNKALKAKEMMLTQVAILSSMLQGKNKEDEIDKVILTQYQNEEMISWSREVNPLPEAEDWFEVVWGKYNQQIGI